MANLYIFCSSLGEKEDSHAIRVANYLNPDVLNDNFTNINIFGVGSGYVREYKVEDITKGDENYNKPLSFLRKNFEYRFTYPDQYKNLRYFVYKKLKECIKKDDVVISASGSVESHLGVLAAKKELDFTWIADYGDPLSYVEKTMRPWFYFCSVRDERNVIKSADVVLVTTFGTKRLLSSKYQVKNIQVLEYGYQEISLQTTTTSLKLKTGHIGVAYKANRDLRPLIHALAGLKEDIHFYLAGPRSGVFDSLSEMYAKKKSNFKFNSDDYIEYLESIKMLSGFNIMPIVGNKSIYQIPGKCFILISLPIPILYIKQTDSDPFLEVFKDSGGILVCENSISSITEMLNYFIKNQTNILESSKKRINELSIQKYSDKNLTKRLINIINYASKKCNK